MEIDTLIDLLIKEKGGTRQQYHLLMDKIAHHESKNDSTIHQLGGGPGRGLFQFETGKFRGGNTAVNRLTTYLKSKNKIIPKWLKEASKDGSVDASTLTPDQQKMLFLGNMRNHPKADFKNIWDGKETEEDFWAKYHWAGDKKDELKRRKSFQRSQKEFINNSVSNPTFNVKTTDERSFSNKAQDATLVKPQAFDPSNIPTSNIKIPKYEPSSAAPTMKYDNIMKTIQQPVQQDKVENDVNNSITYNNDYTNFSNNQNMAAYGGYMKGPGNRTFNEFNEGGAHEQNPHGGIPLGTGSNGKMNTVEQDETSYEFKEGKYIFSNRIKI